MSVKTSSPDEALSVALAAGRAAWPELELDADVFSRFLIARISPGASHEDARAADLYLACACIHRVPGAIAAFERRHLAGAPAYLLTFGSDRSFIEDVLQDVRERLFVGSVERAPRIEDYTGRGTLEAFVRVMVTRVALDRHEHRKFELPVPEPADEIVDAADPELRAIRAQFHDEFLKVVREVLGSITPEERTLLRLYLVDRLNIAQIGSLSGVSRATVGRRIVAFRERVLVETRRLLEERYRIAGPELDSLLRLYKSDLANSLHGILTARPAPG